MLKFVTVPLITKKDGLCSNNVNTILEDRKGNIWFACMQSFQPEMTGDGGVCLYNGSSFTKFTEVKGLSENDIYTIYETRAGDLWIGATNVGAYRYDGNAFTLFDKTDRMQLTRHFGLQSILEARNGTLWFGFSGGLFRFNGQSSETAESFQGVLNGQSIKLDRAPNLPEAPSLT